MLKIQRLRFLREICIDATEKTTSGIEFIRLLIISVQKIEYISLSEMENYKNDVSTLLMFLSDI